MPAAARSRLIIPPGGCFTSFRTFELPFDSTDRERRGLAVRRMYRTVAPWVTENPILMHVRGRLGIGSPGSGPVCGRWL